jgi:branched-subunit amino acid aminotransferase/4-amino-4-deoxychorismate lyase
MVKYYAINGEIVPKEDTMLGIDDLAILRGYGMFDFFLIRKGQPLFFEDYLDRFERSARLLRLEIPYTRQELKQQILQLVRANGLQEAGLKLVLTGGYSPDGYSLASQSNLLILESPLPHYNPAQFEEGIKLLLCEYHRTIPAAKTINYIMGIYMIPEIKAAGAEDVLFHFNGLVHETTRANFFIVKQDDTVVTAGEGILRGITRKKTLEVARQHHFLVEERDLSLDELKTAREAFITNSTKQITPVVRVDDMTIGDGKPGEITRKLMKLLDEEVERYLASAEQ